MHNVAVSAWATSTFTKGSKMSLFELACEPSVELIRESGISAKEIDAVLFSSCATDQYSSVIISEMLGIYPRISYRVDNLCNSGTNAVASAFAIIASGLCNTVLVVGAEKADSPGNKLVWDVSRGSFMFPVHWAAIFAKAHMRKYGTTEEQMAMVSVKNHKNAAKNDNALFRKEVTLQEVMNSKKIASPIKLLDCSASCEGASAILLVSEEKARSLDNPVFIKGIGQQTTSASFAKATPDLTTIEAARRAAHTAFEMSHTKLSQIDVAELHDAFTILEILGYEDLGFAKKGEGGKFVNQEQIVINPRGGIIGCGHPVGATGVAQVAEIASQLAGKAGKRQVKNCKTGLVHNLAAAGSSASVIVMGV
ncbi:thiolase family protein [Candidatus Woesearchaeota archaeon]|nr:thiolase family protein [Candidatus Woesearchaeota archaeon]